jgi:hypothetical protein
MLLGGGKYLKHRKQVKRELTVLGFKKLIIMEVFFCNDVNKDMSAVIFEIGWICGKHGIRKIGTKLRFILESGYNIKQHPTAYISALFNKVPRMEFDESRSYGRSSELIRTFLVSI